MYFVVLISDGREKKLRTRKFFVPAIGGWNSTDSVAIAVENVAGLSLADLKVCDGAGFAIVPEDYVSGLTIQAVIVSGSGNIYGQNTVYYGQCGEDYDLHETTSGYAAVAVTAGKNSCIQSISPTVSKGDILRPEFTRDAVDALDTLGAACNLTGWIMEYTADS